MGELRLAPSYPWEGMKWTGSRCILLAILREETAIEEPKSVPRTIDPLVAGMQRQWGRSRRRQLVRRLLVLAPFVAVESALVAIFQYSPEYRQAAIFAASIAAVTFSLYNYLISQAQGRVGAAVELMHKWNSTEFWQTRMIARTVLRHDVSIDTIMMRGTKETPEALPNEAARLRDALIQQCGFLETVALSITHGRADEEALFQYFKKSVLTSYPTLERWIDHERVLWGGGTFFEHYEALYRRWNARDGADKASEA